MNYVYTSDELRLDASDIVSESPILGVSEAEAHIAAGFATADKQRQRLRLVLLGYAARCVAAADPTIRTATQAARVLAADLATPEAFGGEYRRLLDSIRKLSRPSSRLTYHTLREILKGLENLQAQS